MPTLKKTQLAPQANPSAMPSSPQKVTPNAKATVSPSSPSSSSSPLSAATTPRSALFVLLGAIVIGGAGGFAVTRFSLPSLNSDDASPSPAGPNVPQLGHGGASMSDGSVTAVVGGGGGADNVAGGHTANLNSNNSDCNAFNGSSSFCGGIIRYAADFVVRSPVTSPKDIEVYPDYEAAAAVATAFSSPSSSPSLSSSAHSLPPIVVSLQKVYRREPTVVINDVPMLSPQQRLYVLDLVRRKKKKGKGKGKGKSPSATMPTVANANANANANAKRRGGGKLSRADTHVRITVFTVSARHRFVPFEAILQRAEALKLTDFIHYSQHQHTTAHHHRQQLQQNAATAEMKGTGGRNTSLLSSSSPPPLLSSTFADFMGAVDLFGNGSLWFDIDLLSMPPTPLDVSFILDDEDDDDGVEAAPNKNRKQQQQQYPPPHRHHNNPRGGGVGGGGMGGMGGGGGGENPFVAMGRVRSAREKLIPKFDFLGQYEDNDHVLERDFVFEEGFEGEGPSPSSQPPHRHHNQHHHLPQLSRYVSTDYAPHGSLPSDVMPEAELVHRVMAKVARERGDGGSAGAGSAGSPPSSLPLNAADTSSGVIPAALPHHPRLSPITYSDSSALVPWAQLRPIPNATVLERMMGCGDDGANDSFRVHVLPSDPFWVAQRRRSDGCGSDGGCAGDAAAMGSSSSSPANRSSLDYRRFVPQPLIDALSSSSSRSRGGLSTNARGAEADTATPTATTTTTTTTVDNRECMLRILEGDFVRRERRKLAARIRYLFFTSSDRDTGGEGTKTRAGGKSTKSSSTATSTATTGDSAAPLVAVRRISPAQSQMFFVGGGAGRSDYNTIQRDDGHGDGDDGKTNTTAMVAGRNKRIITQRWEHSRSMQRQEQQRVTTHANTSISGISSSSAGSSSSVFSLNTKLNTLKVKLSLGQSIINACFFDEDEGEGEEGDDGDSAEEVHVKGNTTGMRTTRKRSYGHGGSLVDVDCLRAMLARKQQQRGVSLAEEEEEEEEVIITTKTVRRRRRGGPSGEDVVETTETVTTTTKASPSSSTPTTMPTAIAPGDRQLLFNDGDEASYPSPSLEEEVLPSYILHWTVGRPRREYILGELGAHGVGPYRLAGERESNAAAEGNGKEETEEALDAHEEEGGSLLYPSDEQIAQLSPPPLSSSSSASSSSLSSSLKDSESLAAFGGFIESFDGAQITPDVSRCFFTQLRPEVLHALSMHDPHEYWLRRARHEEEERYRVHRLKQHEIPSSSSGASPLTPTPMRVGGASVDDISAVSSSSSSSLLDPSTSRYTQFMNARGGGGAARDGDGRGAPSSSSSSSSPLLDPLSVYYASAVNDTFAFAVGVDLSSSPPLSPSSSSSPSSNKEAAGSSVSDGACVSDGHHRNSNNTSPQHSSLPNRFFVSPSPSPSRNRYSAVDFHRSLLTGHPHYLNAALGPDERKVVNERANSQRRGMNRWHLQSVEGIASGEVLTKGVKTVHFAVGENILDKGPTRLSEFSLTMKNIVGWYDFVRRSLWFEEVAMMREKEQQQQQRQRMEEENRNRNNASGRGSDRSRNSHHGRRVLNISTKAGARELSDVIAAASVVASSSTTTSESSSSFSSSPSSPPPLYRAPYAVFIEDDAVFRVGFAKRLKGLINHMASIPSPSPNAPPHTAARDGDAGAGSTRRGTNEAVDEMTSGSSTIHSGRRRGTRGTLLSPFPPRDVDALGKAWLSPTDKHALKALVVRATAQVLRNREERRLMGAAALSEGEEEEGAEEDAGTRQKAVLLDHTDDNVPTLVSPTSSSPATDGNRIASAGEGGGDMEEEPIDSNTSSSSSAKLAVESPASDDVDGNTNIAEEGNAEEAEDGDGSSDEAADDDAEDDDGDDAADDEDGDDDIPAMDKAYESFVLSLGVDVRAKKGRRGGGGAQQCEDREEEGSPLSLANITDPAVLDAIIATISDATMLKAFTHNRTFSFHMYGLAERPTDRRNGGGRGPAPSPSISSSVTKNSTAPPSPPSPSFTYSPRWDLLVISSYRENTALHEQIDFAKRQVIPHVFAHGLTMGTAAYAISVKGALAMLRALPTAMPVDEHLAIVSLYADPMADPYEEVVVGDVVGSSSSGGGSSDDASALPASSTTATPSTPPSSTPLTPSTPPTPARGTMVRIFSVNPPLAYEGRAASDDTPCLSVLVGVRPACHTRGYHPSFDDERVEEHEARLLRLRQQQSHPLSPSSNGEDEEKKKRELPSSEEEEGGNASSASSDGGRDSNRQQHISSSSSSSLFPLSSSLSPRHFDSALDASWDTDRSDYVMLTHDRRVVGGGRAKAGASNRAEMQRDVLSALVGEGGLLFKGRRGMMGMRDGAAAADGRSANNRAHHSSNTIAANGDDVAVMDDGLWWRSYGSYFDVKTTNANTNTKSDGGGSPSSSSSPSALSSVLSVDRPPLAHRTTSSSASPPTININITTPFVASSSASDSSRIDNPYGLFVDDDEEDAVIFAKVLRDWGWAEEGGDEQHQRQGGGGGGKQMMMKGQQSRRPGQPSTSSSYSQQQQQLLLLEEATKARLAERARNGHYFYQFSDAAAQPRPPPPPRPPQAMEMEGGRQQSGGGDPRRQQQRQRQNPQQQQQQRPSPATPPHRQQQQQQQQQRRQQQHPMLPLHQHLHQDQQRQRQYWEQSHHNNANSDVNDRESLLPRKARRRQSQPSGGAVNDDATVVSQHQQFHEQQQQRGPLLRRRRPPAAADGGGGGGRGENAQQQHQQQQQQQQQGHGPAARSPHGGGGSRGGGIAARRDFNIPPMGNGAGGGGGGGDILNQQQQQGMHMGQRQRQYQQPFQQQPRRYQQQRPPSSHQQQHQQQHGSNRVNVNGHRQQQQQQFQQQHQQQFQQQQRREGSDDARRYQHEQQQQRRRPPPKAPEVNGGKGGGEKQQQQQKKKAPERQQQQQLKRPF